tara:strand:+ start:2184 stop:3521 length:1338 start_codon:yes stop_codon:yes gene_type:complete
MKDSVQFINHASVKISIEGINILCDPWYDGSIFNYGWNLIYDNVPNYEDLLNNLDYIWISHEHPDHFSIKFFNDNVDLIKENNITILFQTTKDKRVINFLKKKNFKIREISNNKKINIAKDLDIAIYKDDFYDSALLLYGSNNIIFNINDHHLDTEKEIEKFKVKFGTPTVLLTQFSYAAWRGNVDEKILRVNAANEKIDSIKKQIRILNPKFVIPFASFVYFSNVENYYMNDAYNTPNQVLKNLNQKNTNILFFEPLENWIIGSKNNNKKSLIFWEEQFEKIKNNKLNTYEIINKEILEENYNKYVQKLKQKNNFLLMRILSFFPLINAFKPFTIYLHDLNTYLTLDIFRKFNYSHTKTKFQIKMHSNSLNFIFKNEFGFDTLLVNACFESNFNDFIVVSKTLSIGSLNAMGTYINLRAVFDYKLFIRFMIKIIKARKKFRVIS